jgi:hypothetical protein
MPVAPGTRQILRSDPDLGAGPDPFWERLAETVAWCSRRVDPAEPGRSLRSPELQPCGDGVPLDQALRQVAAERLTILGRSWRRTLDPLGGGRLLLWYPALPSSDGAARAATAGLFDERDCPPWDTWVCLVEEDDPIRPESRYLVAWIPPSLTAIAGLGVAVAGAGSLGWLDERPSALAVRLRRS